MYHRLFYATTREQLSQEFGDWLSGMSDWEWYATFTFRNPSNPKYPNWSQVGWGFAHKALNSFNSALVTSLGYQNPTWVGCMELQRRGVPHWHMLVSGVEGQRRMAWVDWWWSKYGIGRVVEYDKELGARYYLGKYLTKEVADIRFSPALQAQLTRNEQGLIDNWRISQLYGGDT